MSVWLIALTRVISENSQFAMKEESNERESEGNKGGEAKMGDKDRQKDKRTPVEQERKLGKRRDDEGSEKGGKKMVSKEAQP